MGFLKQSTHKKRSGLPLNHKAHLVKKFYPCLLAFYLIALSRRKEPKHFVWFAITLTAASHRSSDSITSQWIPTFFGFQSGRQALSSRTSALSKSDPFYEKVKKELEEQIFKIKIKRNENNSIVELNEHLVMGACDNAQKNEQLKHQRQRATSNFVKLTARVLVKVELQMSWTENVAPAGHSILTYMDQAVPSPIGLPPFELLTSNFEKYLDDGIDIGINTDIGGISNFSIVEFTGKRVKSYLKLLEVASECSVMNRILGLRRPNHKLHPNYSTERVVNRHSFPSLLNPLQLCQGFFHNAKHFQTRMVSQFWGK